jgi:hypothetical protein
MFAPAPVQCSIVVDLVSQLVALQVAMAVKALGCWLLKVDIFARENL